MKLHLQLRTLAVAALVALAILTGPAGLALAAPRSPAQECRAGGGVWVEGRGCAYYRCDGDAVHGQRRVVRNRVPGQILASGEVTQECNGFTGRWETVNAPAPSQGGTVPTLEQTDSTRPLPTEPVQPLTPSR
jgi:hypothetical protein